jgi:hypothetical protein
MSPLATTVEVTMVRARAGGTGSDLEEEEVCTKVMGGEFSAKMRTEAVVTTGTSSM